MEGAASIGAVLNPEQAQELFQDFGFDIDKTAAKETPKQKEKMVNVHDLAGKGMAHLFTGGPSNRTKSKVKVKGSD